MNLRHIVARMFGAAPKQERCAACGGKFSCGANLRGCWCGEVQLSEAARAELRRRYAGCLCRACLERYAAAPPLAPAPRRANRQLRSAGFQPVSSDDTAGKPAPPPGKIHEPRTHQAANHHR